MNPKGFYYCDSNDHVHYGRELQILRRIFPENKSDISDLALLSKDTLTTMLNESKACEDSILKQAEEIALEWEKQAIYTRLLEMAMGYKDTPAIIHTSNTWVKNSKNAYGYGMMRSNAVYMMTWNVNELVEHDALRKRPGKTVAWYLTWNVNAQTPDSRYPYKAVIAHGPKKRFSDKATMWRYLNRRIKTYDNLFTEISPPVPKKYANRFSVNGLLLPGYKIAE